VSLQLHDIGLVVEGVAHLDNIEVEFERGRLTTVLGRTLAGKTTLMRSIAGLQRLDRGTVQVDGRDYSRLPTWQRDIAMVYQQFINYPHLNVYENVAFPLRRKNLSEETIRQRVDAVLEKVGLSAFERRRPSQLSRRPATSRGTGARTGARIGHPAAGRTAGQSGFQAS